jgi:hypothetical protein
MAQFEVGAQFVSFQSREQVFPEFSRLDTGLNGNFAELQGELYDKHSQIHDRRRNAGNALDPRL